MACLRGRGQAEGESQTQECMGSSQELKPGGVQVHDNPSPVTTAPGFCLTCCQCAHVHSHAFTRIHTRSHACTHRHVPRPGIHLFCRVPGARPSCSSASPAAPRGGDQHTAPSCAGSPSPCGEADHRVGVSSAEAHDHRGPQRGGQRGGERERVSERCAV